MRVTAHWQDRHARRIRADWSGRPYVELTFGTAEPSEVINVWDDEAGQVIGRLRQHLPCDTPESWRAAERELKLIVGEWVETQEDPDWYEAYLENARW